MPYLNDCLYGKISYYKMYLLVKYRIKDIVFLVKYRIREIKSVTLQRF